MHRSARTIQVEEADDEATTSTTVMNSTGSSNLNRQLLQIFMAKGILSDEELSRVYDELKRIHKSGSNVNAAEAVGNINHDLRFIFLEIRKARMETTGALYWGLVNTSADEYSQLCTAYSLQEIELFKLIVRI